ncbi:MAG TPA: gliding motility-associated C-terminal domain-containing protein [Cyclobacteriaceae bacterium]|nr:gliding motility-associated C-terminal domain-containing protein [Cyclobacteriaceae bacterium]
MKKRSLLAVCLFLPPLLFHSHLLFSSHMRAAEITAERISCDDLSVRITITAYLKPGGVFFGGEVLDFGDGKSIQVPELPTIERPDLGSEIGIAVFQITHTYDAPGLYAIQYAEKSRNEGVLNLSNSVITPLSVKTTIRVDPQFCNSYPLLSIPPVDRACSGVSFFHNPGVFDLDGDSISFELIEPINVSKYVSPSDAGFYLPGEPLNEKGDGPAIFMIDPLTGLLTWDAPGVSGEYNIAIQVTEWRKNPATGEPIMMSSVIRDMQIIVEDCENKRPDLMIPEDTCVTAGSVINEIVFGKDPELNPVKIDVYSELLELPSDKFPASYSPYPPDFTPSNPPAELTFQWNTNCVHVRNQPYQVVFKITDQPSSGPKLVTYKTWRIKVVAPKPQWQNVVPDLVNRYATLTWDAYACSDAESVQIWRKVDSFAYTSENCESRLLSSMGYELIDEVDPSVTQYLDTNRDRKLSVGAKYCYRLTAKMPGGILSPVSDEFCMEPISVDAPVITNVSVESTSYDNGQIRISWRSPFEISKIQYPEPYQYEVYRGEGIDHSGPLIAVNRINDTTFVDEGLNTKEKTFHYTIVLYSKTQNNQSYSAVDTSAMASSVWLTTTPGDKQVSLQWGTNVPWSNYLQKFPNHLIYRGEYGKAEDQLTLIDSVDVTSQGLNYTDSGKYLDVPLDDDKLYCYKIMTRGGYGNPKVHEPLVNFSPMMCSYPINDLPVCSPIASVVKPDCEQFLSAPTCGPYNLSNTIYWEPGGLSGCRLDIRFYSIYASNRAEGEYQLIGSNVRDTFFVESNLPSQARCYRLTTTDELGRVSNMSDPVCNDNCVYYELPNVFTPNGDGCNDRFSAYYELDNGTGEEVICHVIDLQKCPRFVKQVSFKVYNRWGTEVFRKVYDNDQTININWDGRDNEGRELASATYYYEAEVKFDAIDPMKQNQILKGWVQLIR